MKNIALFLFSILLIANFSSCKKDEPDLLDHEIRLIDSETEELFRYKKYNSSNQILIRNGNDDSKYTYTFDNSSFIPIALEHYVGSWMDFTNDTYYYFDAPILKSITNHDIGVYTYYYVLDENFKVLYELDSRNDTTETYNYQNGMLQSIISDDKTVTSFKYNSNNQLIEVFDEDPNDSRYDETFYYDYTNGKMTGYRSRNKDISYEYCEDILCNIRINSYNVKSSKYVVPYSYFEPLEMNPINLYLFPYLELTIIGSIY